MSVKIWIFDDPFHKRRSVLVILMPLMIKPSESGSFLGNRAVEAVEASGAAEATEVNEAAEVCKAWKITTASSRFLK